ncbi:LOW QUALITY PROTEIN: uncharacterized protein LOC119568285, partial [Penaeus monodon]|uniref:LOW QUALITY PROTEIN: uncharacterized protein LOC119568285 n=1 Tax=Penaeus monodon TaxID=6687 RepID=UPI0018A73525
FSSSFSQRCHSHHHRPLSTTVLITIISHASSDQPANPPPPPPPGGLSLRIRNFEVPLHVPRGDRAVLKCEFDLQGERLYSVKWYKGGREFFRYVPNERPMKQSYNVTGIEVDHEASTGQQVVLKDGTMRTTPGRTRAKGRPKAPAQTRLSENAILTVVAIPKEKPIVQGAQERYRPGDYVRVNCTSAPSKPAATLTWFINDNIVPSEYLVRYPPIMLPDGLEQSTQGLHFKATHEHFPHNIMSLRCAASIGFFYNKTEETSLETHRPALSLESRKHFYGSRSAPLPRGSLGLTLVLLACALGALR